ncbi:MAG: hypothetical protein ING39_07495 [Burkholderiales bacterium]|nr:hypothetical protein [Burkholderiales bacterium]
MSKAAETFAHAILDSERLLENFNKLNTLPPPPDIEVLKRAGLVMAMTAWETYVEDRVQEAADIRLSGLTDAAIGTFVRSKLTDEIKRLHNPTSEKTAQLFRDYANVDVTAGWVWPNFDPVRARETLNSLMKLRGDVVHRSRPPAEPGPPQPHPVTKEDLRKAIRFLRDLVDATEKALVASKV